MRAGRHSSLRAMHRMVRGRAGIHVVGAGFCNKIKMIEC